MAKVYTISSLKNRVELCSMRDTVEEYAQMSLARIPVAKAWASIMPKRGSFFSTEGYAVKETRDVRSHQIIIRFRADILVESAAWIYEERIQSPPRWYKVLSVGVTEEAGRWYVFDVRLVEASDFVTEPRHADPGCDPIMGAQPQPEGVLW